MLIVAQSREWIYLQTPQFILSNASDTEAPLDLELTVRHGAITGGSLSTRSTIESGPSVVQLGEDLLGCRLHEIRSWENAAGPSLASLNSGDKEYLLNWLQSMLLHVSK